MRGNMKAERARAGLSAKQAASCLGVSVNTLLRWETGESEPLAKNVLKLARLYGCNPEYLMSETKSMSMTGKVPG